MIYTRICKRCLGQFYCLGISCDGSDTLSQSVEAQIKLAKGEKPRGCTCKNCIIVHKDRSLYNYIKKCPKFNIIEAVVEDL